MKATKVFIAISIVIVVIWALFHRAAIHEWMQQPITELSVSELIMIGYFVTWIGSSITVKLGRK
jgi:hypothetical protein